MDKTQKFFIRKLKRDNRKAILSLDNTKIVLLTILLMIASFVLSYKLTEEEWFSQLTLAIGTGILTGLIFYFISNIRYNGMCKIQNKINFWEPIVDEFYTIDKISSKIIFKNSIYFPQDVDWCQLLMLAEYSINKLKICLSNLPEELYEEIGCKQIDNNFFNILENVNSEKEFLKCIVSIKHQLSPIADKADFLIKEQKLKASLLNKYFF